MEKLTSPAVAAPADTRTQWETHPREVHPSSRLLSPIPIEVFALCRVTVEGAGCVSVCVSMESWSQPGHAISLLHGQQRIDDYPHSHLPCLQTISRTASFCGRKSKSVEYRREPTQRCKDVNNAQVHIPPDNYKRFCLLTSMAF